MATPARRTGTRSPTSTTIGITTSVTSKRRSTSSSTSSVRAPTRRCSSSVSEPVASPFRWPPEGSASSGVDASAAMLAKLSENDPSGSVSGHLGDMVDDLPAGPFTVAFAAFNTLFNLLDAERQQACFVAVAERLSDERRVRCRGVRSRATCRFVGCRSIDDRRLSRPERRHQRRCDPDRAGPLHLVQRIRRRASAPVGDPLRHHRSTRHHGVDSRAFDSPNAGRIRGAHPFSSESPRHITVYRTIHSRVRPEGGSTS